MPTDLILLVSIVMGLTAYGLIAKWYLMPMLLARALHMGRVPGRPLPGRGDGDTLDLAGPRLAPGAVFFGNGHRLNSPVFCGRREQRGGQAATSRPALASLAGVSNSGECFGPRRPAKGPCPLGVPGQPADGQLDPPRYFGSALRASLGLL